MLGDESVENLVTWVYEEGSYVPVAKLQNGERYTIISDYMGRPVEAYDSYGTVVWQADYDIYGDLRNIKGIRDFIPFRQLGQYEDDETRLYYNRFRYYDPRIGNYISQDPIRLMGNNPTLYGYIRDSNLWVDVFGLEVLFRGMKQNNNVPLIGNTADKLGVRPNVDIKVVDGKVYPNSGGMSVNTSITNIPPHRKPIEFGGTQKGSSMFQIDSDNLGDLLMFKPDKNGTHGVIEPARSMTLEEYQEALNDLQNKFKTYV
ncbi:RHS repeat domain-containing protein [Prevotella fusca]|uniref:RHS repeat domain-containing protein n=1 Tax=Prevotella fusca TaxID=589436 RepID=UPI0004699EAC|nr:RHS repeat-associated core domain-containing protein [Prevotella fusca]